MPSSSTPFSPAPAAAPAPIFSRPLGRAWQSLSWRGEPAWASAADGTLAVVTVQRSRLIYLGSPDGAGNLLNAPYPQVLPDAVHRWPNQGGHRFWLGPQHRWIWPPPAEWEFMAAERVAATGETLTLHHARTDPAYPALVRDYAWDGGRLRCTVRWRDEGHPFYAMHVIPVDLPVDARAQLVRTPAIPLGFVQVQMNESHTEGFVPHPAVTLTDDQARLCGSRQVLKAGFAVQPLTIDRPGGWRLSVEPGPHTGAPLESPDHGYLSQIWVGGPEHDLAELEQLTPFLRGDAEGVCASTIFLRATPPPAR